MLETYDPQWEAKWERANARLKELNDKPVAEVTSANLIDLYAPYVLLRAKRAGLTIDVPRLPDDTDYDTTLAELRDWESRVNRAVDAATPAQVLDSPVSFPARLLAPTRWETLRARWRRCL